MLVAETDFPVEVPVAAIAVHLSSSCSCAAGAAVVTEYLETTAEAAATASGLFFSYFAVAAAAAETIAAAATIVAAANYTDVLRNGAFLAASAEYIAKDRQKRFCRFYIALF